MERQEIINEMFIGIREQLLKMGNYVLELEGQIKYLIQTKQNQNLSQQKPDVKGKKAHHNGEGESTEKSSDNSGCEDGGSTSKYPSADKEEYNKDFCGDGK